jgi:diphosphomevalonate decarboxylase
MLPMSVTVLAHSNIALVKYWGKRDEALNLPAAGSISLTLGGLDTTTTVSFDPALAADRVTLNDALLSDGPKLKKISRFLDRVRALAHIDTPAHVTSRNDFPTGAGLASSASGFAALALAATRAAGLDLDDPALSALARKGSGSAARSILGGFVELLPGGLLADGSDCHAVPIAPPDHWDLRCVIAVCAVGEKSLGSTDAMNKTAQTSPFYDAWVRDVAPSIEIARAAILARDLDALARVAETSCLRMHACALGADPGILYWNGATVQVLHAIRDARATGALPAFFTIDAGPHVKVFCAPEDTARVEALLRAVPGVRDVLHAHPGGPARVLHTEP